MVKINMNPLVSRIQTIRDKLSIHPIDDFDQLSRNDKFEYISQLLRNDMDYFNDKTIFDWFIKAIKISNKQSNYSDIMSILDICKRFAELSSFI